MFSCKSSPDISLVNINYDDTTIDICHLLLNMYPFRRIFHACV